MKPRLIFALCLLLSCLLFRGITGEVTTLEDGVVGSLRQVITDAEPHEVITFNPALQGVIVLEYGEIPITVPLTIEGPPLGIAIHANFQSRIFYVEMPNYNDTVQLSRLGFIGGRAPYGGAIDVHIATLKLKHCLFWNNVADDDAVQFSALNGGAIRAASFAALVIDGCGFYGNRAANEGGAIQWSHGCQTLCGNARWGAIVESSFNENQAHVGGAVNYDGVERFWLFRSSFRGNRASLRGGAVTVNGRLANTPGPQSMAISHSSFEWNKAAPVGENSGTENRGGGVFINSYNMDYALISTSTFTGNTSGSGGALEIHMWRLGIPGYDSGPARVYDCTMVQNAGNGSPLHLHAEGDASDLYFWNNAVAPSKKASSMMFTGTAWHMHSLGYNSWNGTLVGVGTQISGSLLPSDEPDVSFDNDIEPVAVMDNGTMIHLPIKNGEPASMGGLVDTGNPHNSLPAGFDAPALPIDLFDPFPGETSLATVIQTYDQRMKQRFSIPNPFPVGATYYKDRGAVELQQYRPPDVNNPNRATGRREKTGE